MRVQINLSDEMVSRVDEYANKMGVSRSALCSMFVGQGIMAYDKSMTLMSTIGERVGEGLLAEKAFAELGKDLKSKNNE